MLTEQQEEQASLYALDLLESPELSLFQRDMLAKPELQLLVEDLRLCRDVMVTESAGLKAPDHLKEKILQRLSESKPVSRSPKKTEQKYRSIHQLIPWSLAACLTITVGWLGFGNQQLRLELSNLEQQFEQQQLLTAKLETQISTQAKALSQLESQNLLQASTIAQLKSTSTEPSLWSQSLVSVVWDKKSQEGVLVLTQMPAAAIGKIYQLWLIDSGSQGPVSGGTFIVKPNGSARIPFRASREVQVAAQFAISLETGGEKQLPEGPVILAGTSL
jgi:Anti-sigma-K factor rskA